MYKPWGHKEVDFFSGRRVEVQNSTPSPQENTFLTAVTSTRFHAYASQSFAKWEQYLLVNISYSDKKWQGRGGGGGKSWCGVGHAILSLWLLTFRSICLNHYSKRNSIVFPSLYRHPHCIATSLASTLLSTIFLFCLFFFFLFPNSFKSLSPSFVLFSFSFQC